MKCSLYEEVAKAKKRGDLLGLTLPKSEEWVRNSRGHRLHVRTWAAKVPQAKGLVLSLHGMGAHCSRPNSTYLARAITETLGFHFVSFDFHGMGRSEGERGMLHDYNHLLDDVNCVLEALYRSAATGEGEGEIRLEPLKAASCPFYLMGNSLGGAVALSFTHKASSPTTLEEAKLWSGACQGCILLSPALNVRKPAAPVLSVLDWVVVPLLPSYPIPSFFTSISDDSLTWESEEYREYIYADDDSAGGLSRRGSPSFKTAQSILRLCEHIEEIVPLLGKANPALRVLILIDPDDKVVLFSAVERLQEEAPLSKEEGRVKVVPMPGGRHDLTVNRLDEVYEVVSEWLLMNSR